MAASNDRQSGEKPRGKTPIISARNITKEFPGVRALDDVQFDLYGGEVHALVGENGAGKSTLMKIFGGIHQPTKGEVFLDGEKVTLKNPLDAQQRGISVIHQELNVMTDLSVAQNIFFGREKQFFKGGVIDNAAQVRAAQKLLDDLGIQIDARTKAGKLTVASMQMVEIAKALSFKSRVIIMDEPTAALTDTEVDTLFRVIDDFLSSDTAVIYVSHRMDEIKRICNMITILRDGQYIDTKPAAELTIDQIIAKMVGREIVTDIRPEQFEASEDYVLEVEGLCTKSLLRNVGFKLRRGEVLGFAGLMGAGRTETARALVGADPITAGTITVEGKQVKIKTPTDAVNVGIGYLSEDRKRYGLMLDKDLRENVGIASYGVWSNLWGWIRDHLLSSTTEEYVDKLAIKTPSILQRTKNLSGGNQQKVVLARWLARDCEILIIDEPTRGIDVGAKEEIYNLIDELVKAGKSIIVISSEIPEVLRISNRICVMCDGKITGVLDNSEANQENIMELATKFNAQLKEA